jgi:hypothetical protein
MRLLLPSKSTFESRGRAGKLCLPTHDRFVPKADIWEATRSSAIAELELRQRDHATGRGT